MWIKIIGGIIVMFGGYMIYRIMNRAEKKKLEQLDGIIALLRFIRLQIDCYLIPVREILRRCDKKILEKCGASGESEDFASLVMTLDPMPDKEIMGILRSYSGELGSSYRDEQLRSCDRYISMLTKYRDELAEEAKKKQKSSLAVCLCASAGLIILII